MGIKNRIQKAEQDLISKDYENALIQVLMAVGATSRKRYPNLNDNKAFTKYLKDDFSRKIQPNMSITGGYIKIHYNGEMVDIETLIYKSLRCYLFHESEIGPKIVFTEPDSGFSISYNGENLVLGWGIIEILMRIVIESPENIDEF